MKETLEYLIKALVDNPDSVEIEETDEDDVTQYTISLAKEDMGRIIGKEGKVIRSIRNVMKVKAIKENKRINISLAETS